MSGRCWPGSGGCGRRSWRRRRRWDGRQCGTGSGVAGTVLARPAGPTRANWRSAARWRRWRGSKFHACNAKIGLGGDLMVPLLSDRAAALWAPRPAPLNLRRFGSPGRIRTSDQPVNSWLQPRSIAIRCKSVHKIGPLILQGKCIFLVATLCRALHPSACFDRKIRKRNDVRMAVLGPAAGQTPFARL